MSDVQPSNGDLGAEMLPSDRVLQMEAEEKLEIEEKKRQRDPPIVFKNIVDASAEFNALASLLEGKLNDTEVTNLDELRQYVLENEGSWALGDNFLNFVGKPTNSFVFIQTWNVSERRWKSMDFWISRRKSMKLYWYYVKYYW